MSNIFNHLNYGFIGSGSLCQALLKGFLEQAKLPPEKIFLSSRTLVHLKKVSKRFGVQAVFTNEELVQKSQVIFLCVKPSDLLGVLEPLKNQFQREQTMVSFLAGVPLSSLKKLLPSVRRLVRVVPNTPASVGQGLFAYAVLDSDPNLECFIEELFSDLALVLKMKEEQLGTFTVASSSGVGFVLELMQYWIEWLESHHFSSELARTITLQSFLGSVHWAKSFPRMSLLELQSQVASKGGMTSEGIKAFCEGELDSILRYGFEKSALREKELFRVAEKTLSPKGS